MSVTEHVAPEGFWLRCEHPERPPEGRYWSDAAVCPKCRIARCADLLQLGDFYVRVNDALMPLSKALALAEDIDPHVARALAEFRAAAPKPEGER